MKNAEEWLQFEHEIRESLISTLTYPLENSTVNMWSFLRRRLFLDSWQRHRFPKIRRNVFLWRLLFFVYKLSVRVLCKFLTKKRYTNLKKKTLVVTRPHKWGKLRDLKTLKLKEGQKLYDSVITELAERFYEPVIVYEFPNSPHMLLHGIKGLLLRLRDGAFYNSALVSYGYWSIRAWSKAYIWCKHFQKNWENWNGKQLLPPDLFEEFKFCFSFVSQLAIEDLETAKKMLSDIKPNSVFDCTAWEGFRLAITLVAQDMFIPTVQYDFGIGSKLIDITTEKFNYLPDKIVVALKSKYDLLLRRNVNPDRLVLTGSPSSDVIKIAPKIYNREEFCNRLGLDAKNKLILILTSGTEYAYKLVTTVLEAVKTNSQIEILVRPHPDRETKKEYEEIIGSKGKALSPHSDLYEPLYLADLVIGYVSTAIEEAVMFGKPAITITFTDKDLLSHYQKITLRVQPSKLKKTIENALYNPQTQKQLQNKIQRYKRENKVDGCSTERIVNLLEEVIHQ